MTTPTPKAAVEGMKQALETVGTKTNQAFTKSVESVQYGMNQSIAAIKKMTETQPHQQQQQQQQQQQPQQEQQPQEQQQQKSFLTLKKTTSNKVILVETETEALTKLKEMVEEQKTLTGQKRPQKWNFATVPLSCFQDKTLDDVFLAFVRWAKIDDGSDIKDTEELDNNTNGATTGKYNVTRAMERLTAYATWMDQTGRDMIDPPLTAASVQNAWKAWNMKVSYDKAGHFVWWFDIAHSNLDTIREIPDVENLRLFVWLAHLAMLDPQAQNNGCVLVQNLGKVQLWTGMTLVPPSLARKVDRLTIGTMPVKMKQVYVCESPQWAHLLLQVMKPFLSSIVKDRIVFLENPKVLEDILGLDCIPTTFVGTEGKLEKDIVWAAFAMP